MATMGRRRGRPSRASAWIAPLGLALAAVAAIALGAAGAGYRAGWWGLAAAFGILQASVYIGAGALVLALAALILAFARRSWTGAAAAVLAGLVAAGAMAVPISMRRTAAAVPPIHDISTDTDHPPEFVGLRAVRDRSPNGAAYG